MSIAIVINISCFRSYSSVFVRTLMATSQTTPYIREATGRQSVTMPECGLWRATLLALASRDLDVTNLETVSPAALHSSRSLLLTAANNF